ncbi:FxSxx-COOH system tetratricopeptide repeat protein [Streptomyces sp. RFCAC02]|uniref:FxSxx-COOH system tetratricopeptide repeat protein n=1 Tax=Streptomyces sp. RFCAC02 TaxID=2499143 RepID=UPI0010225108|nr:FxSxx-COOH system tetratricopeptide repeat protein [Streptomyces sp. RFCAC02]
MTPPLWRRGRRAEAPAPSPEAGLTVAKKAVAVVGDTTDSAIGPHASVTKVVHQYVLPPRAEVTWPVRLGSVPQEAAAFQHRAEVQQRIDRARERSGTVVLTQVLRGGGGVGKSQLAAHYARLADREGTELIVWVDAAETEQVVAAYARAAHHLAVPGALGEDAEADAHAFREWLAATDRSWLIVLDDLSDPAAVAPWWPPTAPGRLGRVLATTRRRDAALSGGGRAVVDIDVYSTAEALAYLRRRLAEEDAEHLLDEDAGVLVEDLGRLPLALAHAAAYLVNEAVTCGDYRHRLSDSGTRLDALMPTAGDGYPREVGAALLLSLEAAAAADSAGLALPTLVLTALLDPAGHPEALWRTEAVLLSLTDFRAALGEERGVTADEARATLRLLHTYSLITHEPRAGDRAVRIHAMTARAVRDTLSDSVLNAAAQDAANALLELWPEEHEPDWALVDVLRANAGALAFHAGDALWDTGAEGGHAVLFLVGRSLREVGQFTAAIDHWSRAIDTANRILGAEHPDVGVLRTNLAVAYSQAGRTDEAIQLGVHILAARERTLPPDHPDTLLARANLAATYSQAGRADQAARMEEQVLAARERTLPPDHPDTLLARANLAVSYNAMGRTDEAIRLEEQVLAVRERTLPPDHPDTLHARANLAAFYNEMGGTDEAIRIGEHVLAVRERTLPPDHPDTLLTCINLAFSYNRAGRADEAVRIGEHVLAVRERTLPPDHPDILIARANLAASYAETGRTDQAIPMEEQVLAARERTLPPGHPDTLIARANLAASYWQVNRTEEALVLLAEAVADSERVLGSEHPDTVGRRELLAQWRAETGGGE